MLLWQIDDIFRSINVFRFWYVFAVRFFSGVTPAILLHRVFGEGGVVFYSECKIVVPKPVLCQQYRGQNMRVL
jgi:hypothetical protein